jgi:DNA-binding CsgD family transcriptional regulator
VSAEDTHDWPDLTERQRDVLQYLLQGLNEGEVAGRLHISPHTVHNHVKALYRVFDVSSRLELLSRCVDATRLMAVAGGGDGDLGVLSDPEQAARRILSNTPDFILEFDALGTIQFINRLYPYHEPEDVVGTNAVDWLGPGQLEQFMEALGEVFRTGEPQQCTLDIPRMRPDGSARKVQARLSRVGGQDARRVIVVSRLLED